jgi:hypothetical protein
MLVSSNVTSKCVNVETQKKGEDELMVSGVKNFVKVNAESVCGELVFPVEI